jgi:hypothetical protein
MRRSLTGGVRFQCTNGLRVAANMSSLEGAADVELAGRKRGTEQKVACSSDQKVASYLSTGGSRPRTWSAIHTSDTEARD